MINTWIRTIFDFLLVLFRPIIADVHRFGGRISWALVPGTRYCTVLAQNQLTLRHVVGLDNEIHRCVVVLCSGENFVVWAVGIDDPSMYELNLGLFE